MDLPVRICKALDGPFSLDKASYWKPIGSKHRKEGIKLFLISTLSAPGAIDTGFGNAVKVFDGRNLRSI